tara:strand:+ start:458 stop:727 length:270 start_codon:yes stop_codon:yes gene_type:complete
MAFKMKGFSGFKKDKPNKKDFNNLSSKSDTIAYQKAYTEWKKNEPTTPPSRDKYGRLDGPNVTTHVSQGHSLHRTKAQKNASPRPSRRY